MSNRDVAKKNCVHMESKLLADDEKEEEEEEEEDDEEHQHQHQHQQHQQLREARVKAMAYPSQAHAVVVSYICNEPNLST
jgi:hypothetical protein